MSKAIEVTSELFDPFQPGKTRDLSIDQYEPKPFYPVGGKDVSNLKNNTIRMVTKGLNQHLHLSAGYLDMVFQVNEIPYYQMENQVDQFTITTGFNDTFGVRDDNAGALTDITLAAGTYTWNELVLMIFAAINAAANATASNFTFTRTPEGYVTITLKSTGNRILLDPGLAMTLGFNVTSQWDSGLTSFVAANNGDSITGSLNPTSKFIIVEDVNDTFSSCVDPNPLQEVVIPAGEYSWATLIDTIAAESYAAGAAEIGTDIFIQPRYPNSSLEIDVATVADAKILFTNTFAKTLGFLPTPSEVVLSGANSQTLSGAIQIGKSIMHDNILSLFKRAGLWFNNVEVHSIDNPEFSSTIRNLQDLSQDYVDKHTEQWLFTTNNRTNIANWTLKQLYTLDSTRVRVQIPLRRIFPFLETYDKVIRGVQIRVELDKNLNNSEMLLCIGGDAGNVKVLEMAMWIPEVIGSPAVEAKLLEDVISKQRTVIAYEDHEVYRQKNTSQTNITWVLDTISEVPLFIFVGAQFASQLDNTYLDVLNDPDPSTYRNLNLVRAECRVNNKPFPKMPYQISFANNTSTSVDDFARLYLEFLRTTYKEAEFDNGSLLEYTNQFKNIYPLVTFNLSREEDIQANVTENNSIEIFVQFANQPGVVVDASGTIDPRDIYLTALVVYQSKIVLQTDGKSYEFIRV